MAGDITAAERDDFFATVRQIERAPRAVGEIPRECIAGGLHLLRTAPRVFCGALVATPAPTLFVNLPRGLKAGELTADRFVIIPYGWDTHFGGSFTMSVMVYGEEQNWNARVFVAGTDPRMVSLEEGRASLVFARSGVAVQAFDINFQATQAASALYREQWNRATTHRGYRTDPLALFWHTAKYLYGNPNHFSTSELLSISWIGRYAASIYHLEREVRVFEELFRWPSGAALPDRWREWCQIFRDGPLTVDALVQFIAAQYEKSPALLWDLQHPDYHDAIHAVMPDHSPLCNASTAAIQAFLLSSQMTDCGRRVPVLRRPDVGFHGISAEAFEKHVAESYWSRVLHLPAEWGPLVRPSDVPADVGEKSALFASMPKAEDTDASAGAADALLEEALAERKWTIPSGAILDLQIGAFTHVELCERHDGVEFLLRNAANEFSAGGVLFAKDERRLWWEALAAKGDEDRTGRAVGLYLMLAAVIRDFLVVEHREGIFTERPERSRAARGQGETEEPRVVYLPRVVYSQAPDVGRCQVDLGQLDAPRRAHDVRPHLRRCDAPSPVQLFLARRYGIEVPKGYTFVRPHERGKMPREVIYRSRSALHCLYQASPDAEVGRAAWFEFERDVYRLMHHLGFTVQHVAASGRCDRGVDVYATKGNDLDAVCWVIQCKAYRPRNKVGPGIVRELIGTLVEHPQGTRGMIVTTSGFSAEAGTLATKHNVRLMDGAEFSRLLAGVTN